MRNKLVEAMSGYWLDEFKNICSEKSIAKWEGKDLQKAKEAALKGDNSARQYIFWNIKDSIQSFFAMNRKRISEWGKLQGLGEDINDDVDNWISISWQTLFDGYPVSDTLTVGPIVKYFKEGTNFGYLGWLYSSKSKQILFYLPNKDKSLGISQDKNAHGLVTSSNMVINGGEHSNDKEVQDTFVSNFNRPDEDLEYNENIKAALKKYKDFVDDEDLNEKKNGFSPLIAFKALLMNTLKGENAEKNLANIADDYGVSRNTFNKYARQAKSDLVEVFDVSQEDLMQLISVYGAGKLAKMIREKSYIPTERVRIRENLNFELFNSVLGFSSRRVREAANYDEAREAAVEAQMEAYRIGHIFSYNSFSIDEVMDDYGLSEEDADRFLMFLDDEDVYNEAKDRIDEEMNDYSE
ncbi:MAG: hypothetical protein HUJ68_09525 [Clostridia bacterium]|nr:hypothetical protein [Clostridia bacterium]